MRSKVLRYIRERQLLRAGDRVAVAVSGGADSVALLRVLLELRAELGIVLAVAHFNHGLRGEASDADQAFVADLASRHGLEVCIGNGDVRDHAIQSKLTLEAAARDLRYRWFTMLAKSRRFDVVATGHTLDDQAETVLMKFLRGAGTRGVAGIYPAVVKSDRLRVIRPLLCAAREEVEAYLAALGQSWREDESNLDRRFARNRVRHQLVPLLQQEYNPNIIQVLSDAAEMARAEEEYWQTIIQRELEKRTLPADGKVLRLSIGGFTALPLAVQRRLLKRFAESEDIALDFDHVDKLVGCASGERVKAELPGGWLASRKGDCLELRMPQPLDLCPGYEYRLPVAGEVTIPEIAATIRATLVKPEFAREEPEPGTLLSADLIGTELTIRNWRPGDRFRPAYSGSDEKLKRLFSEKRIAAEQRPAWPVALNGEQIVWVRGFLVAAAFAWTGNGNAVKIEELAHA